jgi:glycerol uptake facilitator-like aquaporin
MGNHFRAARHYQRRNIDSRHIPFAPPNDFGLLAMFVLPGFVFGVAIGLALAYFRRLSPKRVPVWVVFAALGHFAAALCVTGMTGVCRPPCR